MSNMSRGSNHAKLVGSLAEHLDDLDSAEERLANRSSPSVGGVSGRNVLQPSITHRPSVNFMLSASVQTLLQVRRSDSYIRNKETNTAPLALPFSACATSVGRPTSRLRSTSRSPVDAAQLEWDRDDSVDSR